MITIRIEDERHYKGFRLKYFVDAEDVTPEIYDFVKKNKKKILIIDTHKTIDKIGRQWEIYHKNDTTNNIDAFLEKYKDVKK